MSRFKRAALHLSGSLVSLSLSLLIAEGPAQAGNNKDEVRASVEADAQASGWNLIWGDHIDHESYGWCIAGYLVFDTNIISSCISVTFSPQILTLGSEVVQEIARNWGEVVQVDELEYQGKIASYRHWKKTSIGKISLPNTHQPYILWRDAQAL